MVPRFHRAGRLADDGKRLCDPDRARNVVFRVAPQDTYEVLNCAREQVVAHFTGAKAGGFMLEVVLRAKTRPRRAKTRS